MYIFIIGISLKLDYVEKGRRENYNVCNQLKIIRHDSIYLSIYISIKLHIRISIGKSYIPFRHKSTKSTFIKNLNTTEK